MRILQTNQFKRTYKKLYSNQLPAVNLAINSIIANPNIGNQKKGDLSSLRVYKFKVADILFLLGYSVDQEKEELTLKAVGPHQNFYRDIKRI